MTQPSTSKTNDNYDKKQTRLAIIMAGIVAPTLFGIGILHVVGIIDLSFDDEKEKFRFEKLGIYPEQLLEPNNITKSTNLFNIGLTLDEEVALVEHILSKMDNLECMNVNWYGIHQKKQIFYNDSVGEIQLILSEIGIDPEKLEQPPFIHFISNPVLQIYIEANCKHVWAIDEVPNQYDPTYGKEPLESCLNHPFFENKAYCDFLPKEPLHT